LELKGKSLTDPHKGRTFLILATIFDVAWDLLIHC
jgi:hypothetical protein